MTMNQFKIFANFFCPFLHFFSVTAKGKGLHQSKKITDSRKTLNQNNPKITLRKSLN